jgi:hypothetical protein
VGSARTAACCSSRAAPTAGPRGRRHCVDDRGRAPSSTGMSDRRCSWDSSCG